MQILKNMSLGKDYGELLNTLEWQNKRQAILKRDNFCCTNCGKKIFLQVHHTYYILNAKPWEYDDNSLVTLCLDCHINVHKNTLIPYKVYVDGVLKEYENEFIE